MSRIFRDANLFVYLVEDEGEFATRVVSLRRRMIEREDELLTSALALGEVLARPVETGDEELARRYQQMIAAAATVLPFDFAAAIRFAEIRRDRAVRAPTPFNRPAAAGVDLFITNDDRLSRKNVQEVRFIQPLATAAL